MSIKLVITLLIFFPIFLFGQTYKGILYKDSITNKYIYKRDCFDNLIIYGRPTLINKYKISDILYNWLYEIKIDSILFSNDTLSEKHKSVFILAHNKEQKQIEQTTIFLLNILYYTDSTTWIPYSACKYYAFNGALPIKINDLIKTEPLHPANSPINWSCEIQSIGFGIKKDKIHRNKFEKIIIKRQKRNSN